MMSVEVSDQLLITFVPIAVYWIYSGIYMLLGTFSNNYRLHSREDEDQKNLVSKASVVKGVLLQQFLQTLLAIILFPVTVKYSQNTRQNSSIVTLARQLITAMLIQDTWQYMMHRLMHKIKFLYKHVHSQHHRLVVPYAFGALYNHPIEVALDTVGAALAFAGSGLPPRASIFFFALTTVKTVDDHCGFMVPWNPIHHIFENNVAYHDVHHQHYGFKHNFSQSYFVFWDRVLGTYMPYSIVEKRDGGLEVRPKNA